MHRKSEEPLKTSSQGYFVAVQNWIINVLRDLPIFTLSEVINQYSIIFEVILSRSVSMLEQRTLLFSLAVEQLVQFTNWSTPCSWEERPSNDRWALQEFNHPQRQHISIHQREYDVVLLQIARKVRTAWLRRAPAHTQVRFRSSRLLEALSEKKTWNTLWYSYRFPWGNIFCICLLTGCFCRTFWASFQHLTLERNRGEGNFFFFF